MAATVKLGDVEVSRIGLGTNRLTDTPENREFLNEAVAAGVNFIDSAHLYAGGESERTIGGALAPFGDLVVATKGGYNEGGGVDGLRNELEQSFESLGTDKISLYYLHRVHPDLEVEEAVGLMNEYRERGRITHLGLSEVTVEQIERARAIAPIAAVQNEYSLVQRKWEEVVDYCTAENVIFVPYFPLRGDDPPTVGEIAESHGATSSQIRLAWLLSRSPVMVPIPGTLSIEHLKENLGALAIELTDEECRRLGS